MKKRFKGDEEVGANVVCDNAKWQESHTKTRRPVVSNTVSIQPMK